MHPDDEVCLCFHVTLRKVRGYLDRESPEKASLISECLGAGTGCHWCVPYLERLHEQHALGETPDLDLDSGAYATNRKAFHKTGQRPVGPDSSIDAPDP